ncbi:hypothetical protein [Ornithinimicrobium sp. W1665]|uniref:hypothetical protein n=1 Tax=Ornithinimicrobium sp. W1665 TaxID=3416666 RepID=UPI003D6B523C
MPAITPPRPGRSSAICPSSRVNSTMAVLLPSSGSSPSRAWPSVLSKPAGSVESGSGVRSA